LRRAAPPRAATLLRVLASSPSPLLPVERVNPGDFATWVVRQGDGWAAVRKPAGVLSQPGSEGPDLVTLGRAALGQPRLGVLHRLDRNVSGLVLVAWSPRAADALTREVREGRVERAYRAVCLARAAPPADPFDIDVPLRKDPRTNEVACDPRGGPGFEAARTRVRPRSVSRAPLGPLAELDLELVTGRSHQLRAHLAFVGLPIVGDPKYGAPANLLPGPGSPLHERAAPLRRPLLHAVAIGVRTPDQGEVRVLDEPPWSDPLVKRLARPRRT
jgi:23S rRNA-/tRNA-specific pseudouridylate synthase